MLPQLFLYSCPPKFLWCPQKLIPPLPPPSTDHGGAGPRVGVPLVRSIRIPVLLSGIPGPMLKFGPHGRLSGSSCAFLVERESPHPLPGSVWREFVESAGGPTSLVLLRLHSCTNSGSHRCHQNVTGGPWMEGGGGLSPPKENSKSNLWFTVLVY